MSRGGMTIIANMTPSTPLLMLLHGLGTNRATWDRLVPLIERDWPENVGSGGGDPDVASWPDEPLDLPGSDRPWCVSLHRTPYGYSRYASAVAEGLATGTEVIVVGHSMGAMVGLALAAGDHGVRVRGVIGLSVKLAFDDGDRARMAKLGAQPVRWFDSRREAIRHSRGLGPDGTRLGRRPDCCSRRRHRARAQPPRRRPPHPPPVTL